MVICLERGADLHMAQQIPLPLTVSCFSKIKIGFTFLVLAHPGSPGQRAVKQVCQGVSAYSAYSTLLVRVQRPLAASSVAPCLPTMWMSDVCRAERLAALTKFLKTVPSAEVTPSSFGSIIVDDSVVKLIEEEVTRTNVSDAAGLCRTIFAVE